MPSMAAATGLLGGYFGRLKEDRDHKEKLAMDAANFLLNTGAVKDYNDLLPFIGELGGPVLGKSGSKATGKGGKGGGMDPHTLIGSLLNPIIKKHRAELDASQSGSATAGSATPGTEESSAPSAPTPGQPPYASNAPNGWTQPPSSPVARAFPASPSSLQISRAIGTAPATPPQGEVIPQIPPAYPATAPGGSPDLIPTPQSPRSSLFSGSGGTRERQGTQGGRPAQAQSQAQSQAPTSGPGLLYTADELEARKEAAAQRAREAGFDVFQREEAIRQKGRVEIEEKKYHNIPWAPGQVAGSDIPKDTLDTFGNPIDPSKPYKYRVLPDGTREYSPQTAAARNVSEGSFDDVIKRIQTERGRKLTSTEVETELTKYRRANMSMTPAERVELARSVAQIRSDINALSPEDVPYLSHYVAVGKDAPRSYFVAANAKDNKAGIAAGITPVTKPEGQQLEGINTASANLEAYTDQILSKLPKEYADRPRAMITVPLKQFLQTDEILAAAQSWDVTVLPMIKALNVSQRITNTEFITAMRSRPAPTDTVAVAEQKRQNLETALRNGANSILNRVRPVSGGRAGVAGGGAGAGGGSPNGTIYAKDPTGAIHAATPGTVLPQGWTLMPPDYTPPVKK